MVDIERGVKVETSDPHTVGTYNVVVIAKTVDGYESQIVFKISVTPDCDNPISLTPSLLADQEYTITD